MLDPTTRLLNRFSAGDTSVSEELLTRIYDQLRGLAAAQLARESPGHSLQPTALVSEAWLSIAGKEDTSWESRRHFYALASKVMRGILVDHARRKGARKRGGDRARIPLEDVGPAEGPPEVEVVDVHEALEALSEVDEELARLVELRFFGGLTMAEAGEVLGLPLRTTERRWGAASAWLRERLGA